MRVTFIRFPDHQRAHVRIERDDGVVYRLDSGPASAETPHDLVHYTVEDALGLSDGIWGAIAGGVVFRSMRHESGRRPPHAGERSKDMIREHRELLQRAELIGGLCERAAHAPDGELPRFHAREPFMPITVEQLRTAAAALHRAQGAWSELAVGGELHLEWPAWRKLRAAATPARTGRPERSRSRPGRSS
ncbi:hypothetical protein [Dactylosporangium sp. NPDC051541]|uniref:hypothetical protein n=1 Tax=Dactylosporangium sp. NPDC051541 TaxID=3363977 RepID=UPI0037B36E91